MYIQQSDINTAYLQGTTAFTNAARAQLYAEINGLSFKDNEISEKLLILLYAVNSYNPVLGDFGNAIERNKMMALLATIDRNYRPQFDFSKPVKNRHTSCVDAEIVQGLVHAVEQYGDFAFTTAAFLQDFQFIQSIGADTDFVCSNDLAQITSASSLSRQSLVPIYDLISSIPITYLDTLIRSYGMGSTTLYFEVPDGAETSSVTIPALVGKAVRLLLRGGMGVPAIVTDNRVLTGGIVRFTTATGVLNAADDNLFTPLEILTIQYV